MKVTIIRDGAALTKAIKAIAARGKALDAAIHQAAVSAAAAVLEHGNIGYCNSLYLAMPAGARHAALTEWFITFAGVSANTGKDKKAAPFVFDKTKTVDLAKGEANPWFALKKSPEPDEVFDVLAALKAFISKAEKKAEITNAAVLEALRGIVASEADERVEAEQE